MRNELRTRANARARPQKNKLCPVLNTLRRNSARILDTKKMK